MSSRTAAVVALLLAPTTADAGPKITPLTPDQQIVIAAVVDDTFPRPRHLVAPIVLCLDVQLSGEPVEEAPPTARGAKGKKERAADTGLPLIRGAPPELIARVARPWRVVSSAVMCRLDGQSFTLDDARTPARLVTVRMTAHVAMGSLRIDWTGGAAERGGVQSRDCTATRGPRGWAVRCGGTWSD